MKALESARLNVTIHPEKDPALFELLSAISNKDARARRILNLATIGMMFEKGQLHMTGTSQVTSQLFQENQKAIKNSDKTSTPEESVTNEIQDDEFSDLSGIFSKGS